MSYKFENLEIYRRSLEYLDGIYSLAEQLPASERFNLKSQIVRAATSIVLNIAEGSTGQSDAEQSRFLSMAMRSLLETVACQQIMRRRGYVGQEAFHQIYEASQELFIKIQAMRRTLQPR